MTPIQVQLFLIGSVATCLIFLPIVWWAHTQLEEMGEQEKWLELVKLLKEKDKMEEDEQ